MAAKNKSPTFKMGLLFYSTNIPYYSTALMVLL